SDAGMRSGVTLRQDDAGMTCGAISRHMTRCTLAAACPFSPSAGTTARSRFGNWTVDRGSVGRKCGLLLSDFKQRAVADAGEAEFPGRQQSFDRISNLGARYKIAKEVFNLARFPGDNGIKVFRNERSERFRN